MSVLDRATLAASPLADLHALASELGMDGFRRLRKAELIDALLAHQGVEEGAEPESGEAGPAEPSDGDAEPADAAAEPADVDAEPADVDAERADGEAAEGGQRGTRRRRGRSRRRGEDGDGPGGARTRERPAERIAEGVVELLGNGSAFLRVAAPEVSDDDVYISAAQVRRCELVSGDRITGPARAPRRSERYPSLVRVDTINGAPADAVTEGTHYEDLPAGFPVQRLALGSEDPT